MLDVVLGGVTWVEAGVLLLALAVVCSQGEEEGSKGLFQQCLHALTPRHHLPLLVVPLYALGRVVDWAKDSWNNALHSTVVLARQSGVCGERVGGRGCCKALQKLRRIAFVEGVSLQWLKTL